MKEKMTEEELQEKYEKEQENIKSLEIETKDGNGESFKNHKKIDLIVKAGAIALAGVITIAGINIARSAKTIQTPEEPTTSQGGPETTDPQEDLEYVLVKPFDINNEKSVKETINAVNENNKKDDSVKKELTENMLKFYNGTLTKDDFPDMKDDDIANEIKNYSINLFEVTSASIPDYVNLKNGEKLTNSEESTKAIVLNSTLNENDYAYETYVTSYDTILNEQKKDIANGNKEDYSENTEDFVYTVKTALDDDKLTNAEKSDIATTSKSQLTLFYDTMTKEDQTYFETDYQSVYNTLACDEWFAKNDIETDIDYDKTNGGDKSKNEYVASDAEDAKNHAGSTGEDETKLVDKGGKPIKDNKGNKETVSEPTTKTSISEKPADVPDKELNKPTKTNEGGKVVSTTKEVETTKKIQEEIVDPETETTTEEIVDVKDENGDTVLTDDEYNKLKRENLKNALINREMATLGGVAGLALMSFAFSDKIITASEKISAKIKRKRR